MCSILNLFLCFFFFWYGFMPFLFLFFLFLRKCTIALYYSYLFILYLWKRNLKHFLFWNCKISCLGIGPGFSFSSQAVIPGNCNLVLYHYSKTMRSGTAPFLFVCMKSTQLYWNRKWTAAVVYTRARIQAHMKTPTQTLTVTKITTAPTGFTNTDNKDCSLHLSGLEFGKSVL